MNTEPLLTPAPARSRTQLSRFLVNAKGLSHQLQPVLHRPGPAEQAVDQGPAGLLAVPRRHAQPARPARPVPAQPQPVPRVPRPVQARDRGAVRERHRDAPGDRPDRQRPRALPAPDEPGEPGGARRSIRSARAGAAATPTSQPGGYDKLQGRARRLQPEPLRHDTASRRSAPAGPEPSRRTCGTRSSLYFLNSGHDDRAALQAAGAVHVRRRDHRVPARHGGPEAEPVARDGLDRRGHAPGC